MSDNHLSPRATPHQNSIDPMQAKSDTTVAYTDGACKGNPGAGGWGAHLIFSDSTTQDLYGGEAHTTNNRMELMGAIQALKHSPRELKLEIWTDSSYVKNGITDWIHGWKQRGWVSSSKKPVANKDLWQQLDALCQARDVDWHWVKGHAGHAGNEKADELANLGVTSSSVRNHNHIHNHNDAIDHTIDDSTKKKAQIATDDWLFNDPLGFDMMDELEDTVADDVNTISDNTTSEHTTKTTTYTADAMSELSMKNTTAHTQTDSPAFDGDTSRANPNFRALLPKPINRHHPDRQLIMDTETTGLDALNGDRVIEVGIVEMIGRKLTGEKLHVYINPKRGMDEEVIRIHGISEAFLADKPTFDQVAQSLYEFMDGAELIAHNATFDMNFLTMEFAKVGLSDFAQRVQVTDSLLMAKRQYPGQKNNLNALVRRLDVGKQDRTFHGALLDSEILAEVYLAMTGGQVSLAIEEETQSDAGQTAHANFANLAASLLESAADDTTNQQWFANLSDEHPEIKAKMAQW